MAIRALISMQSLIVEGSYHRSESNDRALLHVAKTAQNMLNMCLKNMISMPESSCHASTRSPKVLRKVHNFLPAMRTAFVRGLAAARWPCRSSFLKDRAYFVAPGRKLLGWRTGSCSKLQCVGCAKTRMRERDREREREREGEKGSSCTWIFSNSEVKDNGGCAALLRHQL